MAKKHLIVEWSERSLKGATAIRNYLNEKFSEREIANFVDLLTTFEEAVSHFPKLYPESNSKKKLRRAVLNKHLSVYYKSDRNKIMVVAVLDNRMNYSRLL